MLGFFYMKGKILNVKCTTCWWILSILIDNYLPESIYWIVSLSFASIFLGSICFVIIKTYNLDHFVSSLFSNKVIIYNCMFSSHVWSNWAQREHWQLLVFSNTQETEFRFQTRTGYICTLISSNLAHTESELEYSMRYKPQCTVEWWSDTKWELLLVWMK